MQNQMHSAIGTLFSLSLLSSVHARPFSCPDCLTVGVIVAYCTEPAGGITGLYGDLLWNNNYAELLVPRRFHSAASELISSPVQYDRKFY